MTMAAGVQLTAFLLALLVTVKPLGRYMARVYAGERTFLHPVIGPIERLMHRIAGIRPDDEYGWKENAGAMLIFNALGLVSVYGLQRMQGVLPFNPAAHPGVPPDLAFNTAVSFVSNTNWQAYGGETTMSHLTQMLGLTVQNFVSAATGMAVLVLFIRGIARHSAQTLGSFWVDLIRSVLYILLPLSMVLSIALVSQGVVQTFDGTAEVTFLDHVVDARGAEVPRQVIAVGPVASQIAIKQLGTNGGGFFNANAAHPFENPTPLSNALELIAILLIPAALCYTYGVMVGDTREGWAIFAAMLVIFIPFALLAAGAEQAAVPLFSRWGMETQASPGQPGGNMEGKEVRFGIMQSALWATATTAASNGSVNAMHDSFTPMGGFVTLVMMQLGEVVFGGVGSGLYGMLVFVIVAVFVAGLLVGRTPEYLGHKIEPYDMKMASLLILIMPLLVLGGTAIGVALEAGRSSISNPGSHGFSQVLYAFTSTGNNNGSAFAGLAANTPFYTVAGAVTMLVSRYWLAIPALALAGSLAGKKRIPVSDGTLPTHTVLFVSWLVAIVLIVGALNFIPALALGPIVEHLLL